MTCLFYYIYEQIVPNVQKKINFLKSFEETLSHNLETLMKKVWMCNHDYASKLLSVHPHQQVNLLEGTNYQTQSKQNSINLDKYWWSLYKLIRVILS